MSRSILAPVLCLALTTGCGSSGSSSTVDPTPAGSSAVPETSTPTPQTPTTVDDVDGPERVRRALDNLEAGDYLVTAHDTLVDGESYLTNQVTTDQATGNLRFDVSARTAEGESFVFTALVIDGELLLQSRDWDVPMKGCWVADLELGSIGLDDLVITPTDFLQALRPGPVGEDGRMSARLLLPRGLGFMSTKTAVILDVRPGVDGSVPAQVTFNGETLASVRVEGRDVHRALEAAGNPVQGRGKKIIDQLSWSMAVLPVDQARPPRAPDPDKVVTASAAEAGQGC